MSIGIILSLIGGGSLLVVIGVVVVKLKRAKKDRSENKTLKKQKVKTVEVEKKKNKIREEHDEKANDIIDNPNGGNGVLPNTSTEHNHGFRDTCSPDCPAYIDTK